MFYSGGFKMGQVKEKPSDIKKVTGIIEVLESYPNMSRGVRKEKLKQLLEKDKA